MKRYVIDGTDDIRDFLFDLYMRTGKAFLPEDDLSEIAHQNGLPVFSKAEVAYFDDILLDCFVFCNDHHLDLDAIAETLRQEFGFALLQLAPKPVAGNVFPAFR